jgi:hypothetical protein
MAWINPEDECPDREGIYKVKMHTGSMRPKVVEMETRFIPSTNGRHHWQGAFDWNYVEAWWKEDNGQLAE